MGNALKITQNNAKKNNPLFRFCVSCKRYLRISQIQRKRINQFKTFNIFIFYCRKCDLYYIIFKFMNDNEKREDRNEYKHKNN